MRALTRKIGGVEKHVAEEPQVFCLIGIYRSPEQQPTVDRKRLFDRPGQALTEPLASDGKVTCCWLLSVGQTFG